ncbi:Ima1 N-terminal domain-containing protein [Russula dissimulans]|nr:Ima1 N-terminal domain-containing protein [Russula dissimulans]
MGTLLRRTVSPLCFFCQSTISPPPPQPRAFLCPHCACWNHYDANGEILSDDPAMHDESLNRKSFARRASPRKDRLLTTFGSAPFCSVCQSNQRLVVSLLSSYLPPSDDDPDYALRLAGFADYKASIYARYPPVCENCGPLVEEEIRKKDVMARSNALGSWLNESKKKDTRRHVALSNMDRHRLHRELRWWRARGVLWVATLFVAVSTDVAGAMGRLTLPEQGPVVPLLPVVALLSLFWTAWLPTYAHLRRAELQGRKVRVRGRERYNTLQAAAWAGRVFTVSLIALSRSRPSMDFVSLRSRPASTSSRVYFSFALCFEALVSIYSFLTLRLHRAPSVRLIDSSNSRASTPSTGINSSSRLSHTPPPRGASGTTIAPPFPKNPRPRPRDLDSPELLESLSLSSAPIPLRTRHTAGPVFGHPSLRPATFFRSHPPPSPSPPPPSAPAPQSRDTEMGEEVGEDAMDWTPTTATVAAPVRPEPAASRGLGLLSARKAEDATTGLETLLERTNIVDSFEPGSMSPGARRKRGANSPWSWGWVYALSLVPLVAVMYYHLLQ